MGVSGPVPTGAYFKHRYPRLGYGVRRGAFREISHHGLSGSFKRGRGFMALPGHAGWPPQSVAQVTGTPAPCASAASARIQLTSNLARWGWGRYLPRSGLRGRCLTPRQLLLLERHVARPKNSRSLLGIP